MDDRPNTAHGGVDTLSLAEVPDEERDPRQSFALVPGEDANLAAGIGQPGNDTPPQAAGAARDENGRRHGTSVTSTPPGAKGA
jgi:hypothetical protein